MKRILPIDLILFITILLVVGNNANDKLRNVRPRRCFTCKYLENNIDENCNKPKYLFVATITCTAPSELCRSIKYTDGDNIVYERGCGKRCMMSIDGKEIRGEYCDLCKDDLCNLLAFSGHYKFSSRIPSIFTVLLAIILIEIFI